MRRREKASVIVCVSVCVYACVSVCAHTCRVGMKEREGQRLKERKVGGNRRSRRGKSKRGGDIFSAFSCSQFFSLPPPPLSFFCEMIPVLSLCTQPPCQ